LEEVTSLLGRKPFIWENLFANDGPRNCKKLKLRYFTGRDDSLINETSGIGFNLMNQPYLSQLVYLSSLLVMNKNLSPSDAFEKSCFELYTPEFANFILTHRLIFLDGGLDTLSEEQKMSLIQELDSDHTPAAQEILGWLKGDYIVGPECLTD
jgi:hypothetical protein